MKNLERFKESGFTDYEEKEIDEAMNQTEQEKHKGLQFLIDKKLRDEQTFEWIKSQVEEYRNKAINAQNIEQLELIQANLGRLKYFFIELRAEAKFEGRGLITIPSDKYLKILESSIEKINGIKELVEERKPYLKNKKEDINKNAEFFAALSKYVQGLNLQEFNNILDHHSLSPGYPKAIWDGSKSDAIRFVDKLKMKITAFNNCFSFKDGTVLKSNNRDKYAPQSPLDDILNKYL